MKDSSQWSERLAELTKAVGHPLRIRILNELIAGSCVVSELMRKLVVEASLLSKHLAVLREAGLIECETEWRCRRYNLRRPDAVEALLKALTETLHWSGK